MPQRRENDPRRKASMPTPIGMGALAGYGDFEREHMRHQHHKMEEAIVDRHGNDMEAANREVKEYREKHGY